LFIGKISVKYAYEIGERHESGWNPYHLDFTGPVVKM
jgi:hypothetical protein